MRGNDAKLKHRPGSDVAVKQSRVADALRKAVPHHLDPMDVHFGTPSTVYEPPAVQQFIQRWYNPKAGKILLRMLIKEKGRFLNCCFQIWSIRYGADWETDRRTPMKSFTSQLFGCITDACVCVKPCTIVIMLTHGRLPHIPPSPSSLIHPFWVMLLMWPLLFQRALPFPWPPTFRERATYAVVNCYWSDRSTTEGRWR